MKNRESLLSVQPEGIQPVLRKLAEISAERAISLAPNDAHQANRWSDLATALNILASQSEGL